MDRASDAIREIDVITNKEHKIYLKYAFDVSQFQSVEDILSFGKTGIRVARASLTEMTEELGMLDNLKKYRPGLLQAYLGGREYDPFSMGAEADLKKAIAEYAMGNYNKITCILEIPKECRYTNSLTSLVPVFEKDEEGNITVPSQYIKAIVTVAQDGYQLWKGPNYDPSYVPEKGIIDEKEVNRILHGYNIATTNPAVISYAFRFVKQDFVRTGDMGAYKRRLEIFKKIYEAKRKTRKVIEKKPEIAETQEPEEKEVELILYEKKRKGFFTTFFSLLRKCFFGKSTVQSKH